MICRHSKGDPGCGSSGGSSRVEYIYRDVPCSRPHKEAGDVVITPDSKDYDIQQIERIGPHLVLKVLYPNCKKCAYEGNKVMVFLNVGELEVIRWKEIDPHFRPQLTEMDPMNRMTRVIKDPKKAPSPAARFPASEEGWEDALEYARRKGTIGKPGHRSGS